MTRGVRTLLDAARGRDARGTYDHTAVLHRLGELARIAYVEELLAVTREYLLSVGMSEADLDELEIYLARRGYEPTWGKR